MAVEVWALAVWLGALVGFVAFTPQAIRIVPVAVFGRFIGADLRFLTVLGVGCGVVALVAAIVGTVIADDRRADLARVVCILAAIGLSIWGTTIIGHMDALAATVNAPIASLPAGDATRTTYDALHAVSTRVYGGVLVLVFAALGVRSASAVV